MWIANNWKDYEVLDTGNGERLEKWGDYTLRRPDPQVIWPRNPSSAGLWKKVNGVYHRSEKGGGTWEDKGGLPKEWNIIYRINYENKDNSSADTLIFNLKPFSFKHTGLFPEQAANWDVMHTLVKKRVSQTGAPVRVLNLFAYTGGATCALLSAGAHVTHVDASKGMVSWAKENAEASGLGDAPARYLVDDCVKFVNREIRRGNTYDAILLDPPSYGRGPGGELWKLEDNIFSLLQLLSKLLSREPLFVFLNSYTTGLQPGVLDYMMHRVFDGIKKGRIEAEELGLPVTSCSLVLPCGACGRLIFDN